MEQSKKNIYLDCRIKFDSLSIFLKNRRYNEISNIKIIDDLADNELYGKSLYFESCHLASELIEKLFQLLSKDNVKNSSHSLLIYLDNANISDSRKDKIHNLIIKNDNCFVETRYPDYFGFKTDEYNIDNYDIDELLHIANELLNEANNQGYSFDKNFKSGEEYGIYNLSNYTMHNYFVDYLIEKYNLERLYKKINSSYNGFDDELINHEFSNHKINKSIIISLIIKRKYGNSDYDHNISGSLSQKFAYCDGLAKYNTLDWYLANIDRIVYGESGENTSDLETNLSMNFINKKSHDNDIMQNYIYYNACHLAAEAIEKMLKAILLYNGIDYENIKGSFGHSFSAMFEMLTQNQKQLMYNEALSIYNPIHIKQLGTKPNKPDKPIKRFNSSDLDHLYSFDEEDMSDEIISSAVKAIDESEEWKQKGKNLFILTKRIGEMYLKRVLDIMDKAFIETRYPEQYSINFNYKYNLNYMLGILKSLKHMTYIIFEIWRYNNDDIMDYEMNVAKEAHPKLSFEKSDFDGPMGNSEYHIKKQ